MSRIAFTSLPTHLAAALMAAVVTLAQLGGIEALAQQRQVSAHAQTVQLDRVTITGQRASAQAAATPLVRACQPAEGTVC